MLHSGDVLSYLEMCAPFGVNLQRGMNFRIRDEESLILMSRRLGAPYEDKVEQGGQVIIYEGHDRPGRKGITDPKKFDQPEFQPNGRPTQNGLFAQDKGRCVICGCTENLHFDHVIPYSRGGSSKNAKNIQILCARHNLEKKDTIE